METEERLAEILGDWHERRSHDESITPDDVIAEHPALASELRTRFAALDIVDAALARTRLDGARLPPVVGDYRIRREIGRGGMGVVYEAEQISMGRTVALKVLSQAVTSSAESVRRFQREARATGRIHHTNIASVYGMGQQDGHWYYAMELVEGAALSEVIDELRRSPHGGPGSDDSIASTTIGHDNSEPGFYRRVARVFAGVARALQAAHAEGVIHRDVKPSNLILTTDGEVKIVDFGLARLENDGLSMTRTGNLIGTPAYMSPEQTGKGGARVDARTDTYSLGATLYELVTLEKPFEGRSFQELYAQITTADPDRPRSRNRHVPRDLETVVLKAMEKRPDRRYATAEELARDLERVAEGAPISARPVGPLGRAWRKVKRHKIRSSLTAAALLLGGLAAVLAITAAGARERAGDAEYERLIADSEDALAQSMSEEWTEAPVESDASADSAEGSLAHLPMIHRPSESRLAGRLARAIELRPERPQAWWLRALASGRDIEERLADLDAAKARGIDPRLCELARQHLLLGAGRLTAADMERTVAALPEPANATEAYFQAELLYSAGDLEQSRNLLTQAINSASAGQAIHYLALKTRAMLHRLSGDLNHALGDLLAVRALGDPGPDVVVRIARVWHLMQNQEEQAAKEFRQVLASTEADGSIGAWQRLCLAAGSFGLPEWHEKAARAAVQAHPDSAELTRSLARALQRRDKREEALRLLRGLGARDPDDAQTMAIHGVLLGQSGDFEGAARLLQRAVEFDGSHAQYERLAMTLQELGRHEEAMRAYEKARDLNMRCLRPNLGRAQLYSLLGQYDKALAIRELICRMAPRNGRQHLNRGALLWNKFRRAEEAMAAFDRVLELDPSEEMAHGNRGVIFNMREQHALAVPAFDKALELDPGNPDYIRGWCDAVMEVGRADEALEALQQLLKDEPKEARNHHLLANALLTLNRHKEALAAATEAVGLDPTHANSHYAQARAHTRLGKHQKALDAVNRALALRDQSESGVALDWNVKGQALKGLKRWKEARDAYRKAREADPDYAMPAVNLAEVMYMHTGEKKEAVDVLDAVLARESLDNFTRGEALTLQARIAMAEGQLEPARDFYLKAIAVDPENGRTYVNYGILLISKMKDRKGALQQFRKATTVAPNLPVGWRNLGVVHRALNQHAEAVMALNKAIALGADNYVVHYHCANSLKRLHRYEEAVPRYRSATRFENRRTTSFYWWADCHIQLEQWAEAEEVLDRLLAIDPKDAQAHYSRALALQNLERLEEALDALARVEQCHPGAWLTPYTRAGVLSQEGKDEEAAESYMEARKRAPSEFWPHNDLSVTLMRMERYEEALKSVDEALKIESINVMALRNKAMILMHMDGRAKDAQTFSARALELDPENAGSWTTHADVLWHLGRYEQAQEHFAKAAEIAPTYRRAWADRVNVVCEMGDHVRGEKLAREAVAQFPEYAHMRYQLVAAIRAQGRADDAHNAALEALEALATDTRAADLAYLAAAAGQPEAARKHLAEFEDDGASAWQARRRAIVLAVLGDRPAARAWLVKAAERGLEFPPGGRADPELVALGDDPAARKILDEITSPAPGE